MSQQSKLSIFFLASASSSTASRAISNSDSDEDVPSEKKKSRTFSQKWLKDFTWLQYNDGLQTKKKPFASYCTYFRLSTLERHEKSKQQLILYFSIYSQNVYTNSFILTHKVKE